MKIQCDMCERAEAAVLCCADEAALCWGCDQKIHAANKLAGKHQRVPLLPRSSGNSTPVCDICQEKAGYFFCLEDRSLLCRQCDVAIHTVSPLVSSHQRFLITGVRVALQHYFNNSGNNNNNSSTTSYANSASSNPLCSTTSNDLLASKKLRSAQPIGCLKVEEMEGSKPTQWSWSDFLDGAEEFDAYYWISEPGSSN